MLRTLAGADLRRRSLESGADKAPARTRRAAAKRRTSPAVARWRERRKLRLMAGDRLLRCLESADAAYASRRR